MKRLMVCVCAFFLVLSQAAFSTTLLAQDNREGNDKGGFLSGEWSLGVGAEYETNLYKGADDEVTPLPLISYQGERFFIEGLTVGVLLVDWNNLQISVIGQYEWEGYEAGDSAFLRGMDKRRGTVNAGLMMECDIFYGEMELTITNDILGRHKGQQIELSYGIEFELENLSLTPYIGINWLSTDFTDYYYGVKETEARSWRPAYKVGSVINPMVGLDMNYSFTEHWMIMGGVSYEMLDEAIENSPIVEENSVISGFLGLAYSF